MYGRPVIVGAGLTGIALSYFLTKAKVEHWLISDKLFGLCDSIKENGHIFDRAGHFWFAASQLAQEIFEEVSQENAFKFTPHALCYLDGVGYIPYPVQGFTEPVTNLRNHIESNCSSSIQRFMNSYNTRVWQTDLKEVSANWLGARLKGKMKSSGVSDKYYMFNGGIESFLREMFDRILDEEYCHFSLGKVTYVSPNGGQIGYSALEDDKKHLLDFTKLYSTMDIRHLIKCMELLPNEYPKVRCSKLFVWDVVFMKYPVLDSKPHWVYYDGSVKFHHIVFPSHVNPTMVRLPFKQTSMQIEFGVNSDKDINDVKFYIESGQVYDDLLDVGIEVNEFMIDFSTYDIFDAYPIPLVGQEQEIFEFKNRLKKFTVTTMGRFGGWSVNDEGQYINYYNMSNCIDEAYKISKEITRNGY